MSTVWRWLSRTFLVLLALVAALAAIWAYGRLTSPTAAQRDALALMQARPPLPAGDNGFELLMALPALPIDAPALPACGDGASCIAAIEAAPEQVSAAIAARREWLEASARALRAPAFRDVRPRTTSADALPAYLGMTETRLMRAFDFSTGQTVAALEAACRDALGAVRRAAEPDLLVDGMIGIAVFQQQAALIADMRRRAPLDPLPEACAALAQAPDPALEGTLCPAMRGEWHFLVRLMDDISAQPASEAPAWALPLMHDPDWMLARSAERFAPHCSEAARGAARDDRATAFAPTAPHWVDRVSRPVSVVLDRVAEPAYTDYVERQLDFVAMRRLLAAFLQMTARDAAMPVEARFAALPAELREGPRPLALDKGAGALTVPQRSARAASAGGAFSLVLPAAPTD